MEISYIELLAVWLSGWGIGGTIWALFLRFYDNRNNRNNRHNKAQKDGKQDSPLFTIKTDDIV